MRQNFHTVIHIGLVVECSPVTEGKIYKKKKPTYLDSIVCSVVYRNALPVRRARTLHKIDAFAMAKIKTYGACPALLSILVRYK